MSQYYRSSELPPTRETRTIHIVGWGERWGCDQITQLNEDPKKFVLEIVALRFSLLRRLCCFVFQL